MTRKQIQKAQNVKKIPPPIISILTGILLIVIAYRLDYWANNLKHQPDFSISERLTWMASAYFADLFIAVFLLIWLWFTHRNVEKNTGFAFVYVVLGVMMPIYSIVMTSISMNINSPSFIVYYSITPLSLASFSSTFIACFGLQRLIFRQTAI